MILELDCGNSFIKWRVIHAADATIVGGGIVDSDQALVGEVAALQSLRLTGCRIVSVRSEDETAALCALIAKAFAVVARVAEPAQQMAGVRNGYDDYQRLGMDRWLAVLGAFHLAKGPAWSLIWAQRPRPTLYRPMASIWGLHLPRYAAHA